MCSAVHSRLLLAPDAFDAELGVDDLDLDGSLLSALAF